jgi:hypothetical protein
MPFSALRELFVLHTTVAHNLRDALAVQQQPPPGGRVTIPGADPTRVLLVGAGLAVGYGVTDRNNALDGALGRVIATLTRRGVTVEHQVKSDVTLSKTSELIGAVGAHTYDLVVWCPTFGELPRTWRTSHWARDLRQIMTHLQDTGDPHTQYLLLGYPLIEEDGATTRVGSWIHRVNARISRIASEFPRTHFTYPPAVTEVLHAFDRDYYTRCAAELTGILADLLHIDYAHA